MLNFKSKVNEIEGIYQFQIDVPFDVKYVCVYLFKLAEKNVLIDAGLNMGNWGKVFFSALNNLNMSIKDIDYCFITHLHLDHIGLVKKLKRKNPDIQIIMNDITHKIIQWETDNASIKEIEIQAKKVANLMIKYGMNEEQGKRIIQFFTFWPRYLQYQKPDIIVHDGDTVLKDLEVIWTPGHSFDHICIFNREKRYLFSGDHILSRITPHIGNFIVSNTLSEQYSDYNFDNILDHYLKSLDRIDKLNSRIIFPAHQEIIYNPHERILEIKKHHENRLMEILSLIKDNPMTPLEISQKHFGNDLDEMNSYMALSEVLGHLFYLENKGEIKKVEKNGKFYYIS